MKKTAKILINIAVMLLCAYIVLFSAINGCSAVTTAYSGGSIGDVLSAACDDFFGAGKENYTEISLSLAEHSYYSPIDDKLCYDALITDRQREAYRSVEQAVFRLTDIDSGEYGKNRTVAVSISGLSSMEIFMVKEAVLLDHPEIFWLNGVYSIHSNMHDGNYMYLYSDYSSSDIVLMAREFEQEVAAFLRTVPRYLGETERELIVHDYIIEKTDYDSDSAQELVGGSVNYTVTSTAYGVLVDGSAICGGYANTFKLLCNRLGLSCGLVLGTVENEGHMWNAVRLGGSWYFVDVTWNDPVYLGEDLPFDSASYDYFNLSTQQLLFNHTISSYHPPLTGGHSQTAENNLYNFFIPECSDESLGYYNNVIQISRLDSENRDTLVSAVLESEPESKIYFRVPEETDSDDAEHWIKRSIIRSIQQQMPGYTAVAVPCFADDSPPQCERVYFMYIYQA